MPKCCVDCRNIESDYVWYSYSEDEELVFYCKYKSKKEKYYDDEVDGDVLDEECDKYNPYKLERNIPHYESRKIYFAGEEIFKEQNDEDNI